MEGDAAKDFEYEYKKRKADTLCDVSLAFNSLVQSLAIKFGGDNTIDDINEAFD